MHRVLAYIDGHLDEQLELDTLARVANFSAFHFHGQFTASREAAVRRRRRGTKDFAGAGNHQMSVIPGGKYAVGRFKGNEMKVGDAWAWLLRDWLPASGMQLDSRPFFESYPVDVSYDRKTGEFECDICIPVTPL